MSYQDDSGYGQGTAGYGDNSTDQGAYGGQTASGYGDDTTGGYGGQQTGGYGADTYGAGQTGTGYTGTGGADIGDAAFQNSQFNKQDVENLKNRTDIDPVEKEQRRKKLMEEVAAGAVGAGVLGFAGYETYQHFNKNDDQQTAAGQQTSSFGGVDGEKPAEKKHGWF